MSVVVTYTFSAGTTANSGEVNQNFSDLVTWLNNRNAGSDTWGYVKISNSVSNILDITSSASTTEVSIDNTATDGDPFLSFRLNGTNTFSIGVDDGDSDSLKIGTTLIGTGTIWAATGAGIITKPLQPAFSVNCSSDITNVTGDGTTYSLVWNTERFDQSSSFANNTFTAPVTGKYLLSVQLGLKDVDSDLHTAILGSLVTSNANYLYYGTGQGLAYGTADKVTISFSVVVDMDINDTAAVTIAVDGSSKSVDISGAATLTTFFSGCLLA